MQRACGPKRIRGKAHGKGHLSSTGQCRPPRAVTPSLPSLLPLRACGLGKQAGAVQETILDGQQRQGEPSRVYFAFLPNTGTQTCPAPAPSQPHLTAHPHFSFTQSLRLGNTERVGKVSPAWPFLIPLANRISWDAASEPPARSHLHSQLRAVTQPGA